MGLVLANDNNPAINNDKQINKENTANLYIKETQYWFMILQQ